MLEAKFIKYIYYFISSHIRLWVSDDLFGHFDHFRGYFGPYWQKWPNSPIFGKKCQVDHGTRGRRPWDPETPNVCIRCHGHPYRSLHVYARTSARVHHGSVMPVHPPHRCHRVRHADIQWATRLDRELENNHTRYAGKPLNSVVNLPI